MRTVLIGGLLAAAGATAAFGQGAPVSRNYPVSGFDRIESAGPYHVEVRTGSAASVSASGPSEQMERLVVEVRNGELRIHPREDRKHFDRDQRGLVRVMVTVPQLRGAGLAGSGDMIVDQVHGASFEGSVAGSGNLTVRGIEVGALNLSVAGSGNASTGRGSARTVDISVAGSGNADTRSTATSTASLSIAGSGKALAFASGTANVSIIGSGDAQVVGGARCAVSRVGSGRANCS